MLALPPLSIQELAIAANLPHDNIGILYECITSCSSFIIQQQDNVHFVHESVKPHLRSIKEVFSAPIGVYHAKLTRSFLNHIGEQKGNRSKMAKVAHDPVYESPCGVSLQHVVTGNPN